MANPVLTISLLFLGLLQGPAAQDQLGLNKELQKDLQACRAGVLDAPRDYDAARCFHVAASRRSKSESGRKQARAQTLYALKELQAEHPEVRYLDIVRGHLFWGDDASKAASIYQAAASRYEELNDPLGAVVAYANAAQLLFWRLHRTKDAQQAMDGVQRIAQEAQDPRIKARATVLLASYACDVGDRVGTALDLLLRFSEKEIKGSPYSLAREVLLSRSTCALHALDFERADRDLELIQDIAKTHKDGATQLMAAYRLAYASLHKLDTDATYVEKEGPQAIKRFEQALAIARKLSEPEQEVRALSNLSVLLSGQPDKMDQAIRLAHSCKEAADKTQQADLVAFCDCAMSQALREKDPEKAYALALGLLDQLPKIGQTRARIKFLRYVMRRAWAVEPMDRAVALADRVLEAIELDRGAQRETLARQNVFAAWTQDYYWLSHRLFSKGGRASEELAKAFEVMERSRARVLLEQMSARVRDPKAASRADKQSQERLAKLLDPGPSKKVQAKATVSLSKVQAQLQSDEAMLLYQTAPDRTFDGEELGGAYVLLVSKTKVRAIPLSTRLSVLRNAVGILRDLIRNEDRASRESAAKLRALIFEPVREELPQEIKNLVIVPDGPLHALPFSAIAPGFKHSVAPSATVWSEIRADRSGLLEPTGMSLVDPLRKGMVSEQGITERSSGELNTQQYRPLPASRREAKAIQRFLGHGVRAADGKAATPAHLKASWTHADRLLHISAHSDVQVEEPGASSLLLSNSDSAGDGRLSVDQIVQMPANHAVVVLAGCATGWGTLLAGEGMLSLARAFQRAGATAVVASLWPIQDELSADFFERFYAELGKGHTVSQSLSLVQESMRSDGFARASYEGFVVLGDGSVSFSVDVAALALRRWLSWSGLAAVAALGVWWMLRRRKKAANV